MRLDFHNELLYNHIIVTFDGEENAAVTEERLKKNIAKNLSSLRKSAGLTQAELGEKLTYSDKSISKWERGDGLPDLIVLDKLAELYGVTINDIVGDATPKVSGKKPHMTNRIIIPLLSVGLVFLVASIIYFALRLAGFAASGIWIIFLYALPVSFIPLIVFTSLWWPLPHRFACASGLVWSLVLCLRLTFQTERLNSIFIIAAITQVLIILWFVLRYRSMKRKKSADGSDE